MPQLKLEANMLVLSISERSDFGHNTPIMTLVLYQGQGNVPVGTGVLLMSQSEVCLALSVLMNSMTAAVMSVQRQSNGQEGGQILIDKWLAHQEDQWFSD